jgi:hypothetical protein
MIPCWRAAAIGLTVLTAGCASPTLSADDRRTIADSLARQVKDAYDLSKPDVAQRMLSLYPPAGPIVSASAGRMTTSRDTLAMGIKAFWDNVGANMRQPQWVWDKPHVIAGAWTAAFEKRGSRWYVVQEHLSDVPTVPDSTAQPGMQPGTMPGMTMPPKTATPGTPKRGTKNPR